MKTISALALLALLTSCGTVGNVYNRATAKSRAKKQQAAVAAFQKNQQDQMEKSIGVDAVGEIVSVDLESQFVLIRNLRVPSLQPNVTLDIKNGSGARLKTCPALKNGFIAADILSGSPLKNEIVVISKTQDKAQPENAAARYLPPGTNEEEYWNNRRTELPGLTPIQNPEGNATIPDMGNAVLPAPQQP